MGMEDHRQDSQGESREPRLLGYGQLLNAVIADPRLNDPEKVLLLALQAFHWRGETPTNEQLALQCGWVSKKTKRPNATKAKRTLNRLEKAEVVRRDFSSPDGWRKRESIEILIPIRPAPKYAVGPKRPSPWVQSAPRGGANPTRARGSNQLQSEDRVVKMDEDSLKTAEGSQSLDRRRRPEPEPPPQPASRESIDVPLAAAMEHAQQVHSLSGEATFYGGGAPAPAEAVRGYLPEEQAFLDGLPVDLRAKFDRLPLATRDDVLHLTRPRNRRPDKALRKLKESAMPGPPRPEGPPRTVLELVQDLPTDPAPDAEQRAATAIAQTIGELGKTATWRFLSGVTRRVRRRELPPEILLDPIRKMVETTPAAPGPYLSRSIKNAIKDHVRG